VARQIVAIFDWLYVGAIRATLKDAPIQIIDSETKEHIKYFNLDYKKSMKSVFHRTIYSSSFRRGLNMSLKH
jgi:hypothetical protein